MKRTFCVGVIVCGFLGLPALADQPAKAPMPNEASLKDAQKLVNEVYGESITNAKTPADKSALAKKLLQAAIDTKNDPAGQYVLLNMAKDLAAGAGDAETSFAAIAQLEQFQIDPLKLRTDALAVLIKTPRASQDAGPLVARVNDLINEATAVDRYDIAKQLADLPVNLAKTMKDADALKVATGRVQEVLFIETAYSEAQAASAAFAENPKDPEANLKAGRLWCLAKNNWGKGLPMFALCSDAGIKALAGKELASPTGTAKQFELADGWWAAAEKENGVAQRKIREHAGQWYKKVLPDLTGLAKAKVEKRLSEIGPLVKSKADQKELVLDLGNKVTMKLVLIPAGKFVMGASKEEQEAIDDEAKKAGVKWDSDNAPQHTVAISKSFYMGIYHVTKGQFAAFAANSRYRTDAEKEGQSDAWIGKTWGKVNGASWKKPGFDQTDEHPVVCVSYNDAVAFCEWLSKKSGKTVRLPTEAEWEYACRAGTTTAYQWGNDPNGGKGWCNAADRTFQKRVPNRSVFAWDDGYAFTSPVGKFAKNGFGLYDMNGNAWQICADSYDKDYFSRSPDVDPLCSTDGKLRVVRGGSWGNLLYIYRAAFRAKIEPNGRSDDGGFRVVVEADAPLSNDRQLLVGNWNVMAKDWPEQWTFTADGRAMITSDKNGPRVNRGTWRIERGEVIVSWGDVLYLPIKANLTTGLCGKDETAAHDNGLAPQRTGWKIQARKAR